MNTMKLILLIMSLLCVLFVTITPTSSALGVEVLVKKYDSVCPAEADSAFCWKRGDLISVKAMGSSWGRQEVPEADKFVIITITDVTLEQAQNWMAAHAYEGEGAEQIMVRLRLRRLIWANLPSGVKTQLATTGRYTTTWVSIKTFIRNMKTGELNE